MDNRERQLAGLGEVAHVVDGVVLHGHGNNIEPFAGHGIEVLNVVRHLRHASGAVRGPEFHQDDLALQIGKGDIRGAGLGAAGHGPDAQTHGNGNSKGNDDYFFHWTGMTSTEEAGAGSVAGAAVPELLLG
uniref:Uncharacterized protein n=1 Tax=Panagrolaimus superbus TaxID=310955 RepID=A0A914YS83_9BILA